MTSKTTNKFSPEVRTRAVRMVLDHAGEHPSRWAAVTSIAAKIGCTPQTLHDWVKKVSMARGISPLVAAQFSPLGRAW
jgi:transposase